MRGERERLFEIETDPGNPEWLDLVVKDQSLKDKHYEGPRANLICC